MTYANETAIKAGAVTLSNANLKDAVSAIAGAVAGQMAGGFVGGHIKSAAMRKGGNLGMNGHGILTSSRFIFGTGKGFKKQAAGDPLGITDRDDVVMDIPVADITAVSRGKQGFSTLFYH